MSIPKPPSERAGSLWVYTYDGGGLPNEFAPSWERGTRIERVYVLTGRCEPPTGMVQGRWYEYRFKALRKRKLNAQTIPNL